MGNGDLSNFLKSLLYRIYTPALPSQLSIKIGYCFHTESIYDDHFFYKLIEFCKQYHEITNCKPISTTMAFTNIKVQEEVRKLNFSEALYIDRINELSQYATIGYHGHFFTSPYTFQEESCHIKNKNKNFNRADFLEQFHKDVDWFRNSTIKLAPIYAAGWWFQNKDVMHALIEKGFKFDLSFSYSPWFYNQYSHECLTKNDIYPGELFRATAQNNSITCIQNLIGCHNTSFGKDFIRNLNKILVPQNNHVIGVVNSHDYDLNFEDTLNCIRYIRDYHAVTFWDYESIENITRGVVKEIVI